MSVDENRAGRPLNRLLKLAVLAGVESAVRIHIRRGDDLNARDSNGQTPLMLAATKGRVAMCRLLIEAGADHTLLDPAGRDAVAVAKAAGSYQAVEAIEEAAAARKPAASLQQHERVPGNITYPDDNSPATGIIEPVPPDSPRKEEHASSLSEVISTVLADRPASASFQLNIDHRNPQKSEDIDQIRSVPETVDLFTTIDAEAGSNPDASAISDPEKFDMESCPVQQKHGDGQVVTGALSFEMEVDADDFFDLSGWEEEKEAPAPKGDDTLAESAAVVHRTISEHVPIDSAEDWEGFEDFLPEIAAPILKDRDGDGRPAIRNVFLRAIREGSVPDIHVSRLFDGENDGQDERNGQGEALVRLVLNELGVETDERIELDTPSYALDEAEEDERDVSAAMAFMDDLAAGQNDIMRLYFRDMGARALLTSEEELSLGRDMEEGFAEALDILAAWPEGVERLLLLATQFREEEVDADADADAISFGHAEPEPSDDTTPLVMATDDDTRDISERDDDSSTVADFRSGINKIATLSVNAGVGGRKEESLRAALAAAGLPRAVLVDLTTGAGKQGAAADRFASAIKRAEQARERMIFCNLRLAASIARRYQGSPLPLEDLVQEGNIGLMKAVERYDWRRGFRFSTYATWWIKQQITRAIADKARTIRLPVHIVETINRMNRVREELFQKTGREADVHSLADAMDVSEQRIAVLLKISRGTLSLDTSDDPEVTACMETLADPDYRNPEELVIEWQLHDVLLDTLETLKPNEKEVVILRYGLTVWADEAHTLEEIGQRFGVTRERIRQIEAKALQKLRHRERSEKLQAFRDHPGREVKGNNG